MTGNVISLTDKTNFQVPESRREEDVSQAEVLQVVVLHASSPDIICGD